MDIIEAKKLTVRKNVGQGESPSRQNSFEK